MGAVRGGFTSHYYDQRLGQKKNQGPPRHALADEAPSQLEKRPQARSKQDERNQTRPAIPGRVGQFEHYPGHRLPERKLQRGGAPSRVKPDNYRPQQVDWAFGILERRSQMAGTNKRPVQHSIPEVKDHDQSAECKHQREQGNGSSGFGRHGGLARIGEL